MRKKLVVVGNGMAGIRTLEELLKIAPDMYDVTVFGAEPHPNYNRIMLSHVLAGDQRVEDIVLNDRQWYAQHGIALFLNKKIVRIDRRRRVVCAEDGTAVPYDRLLLATGSRSQELAVPGQELDGVVGFRTVRDVGAMIEAAACRRQAVVVGGGLLGLEAAHGLKLRGMEVTVVHRSAWLMGHQLDESAARMLQASLEHRGLGFLLQSRLAQIVGEGGKVRAIRLGDGSEIPADLVVMAAGIRPDTALAESAALHCDNGIVVDDTLQTFDPRIYAVGECVSHRGVSYGLVAPLFDMAKVCANHLSCLGYKRYAGSVISTKLKVSGIDLFSAGDFGGGEGTSQMLMHDPDGGVYKKLVIRDNRISGVVLYGDTTDGAWYFQLLREGRDISDLRRHLLFGQAHLGSGGHQGESKAAAMPDEMEVCGCNGITKGDIVRAIREKGLFTLDEVRKHTKAAGSCGSCTGLVEQILASILGGDYSPSPTEKPMCGCTDHTHEEVRKVIRDHRLFTIPEVMKFIDWRTPDGCATCRPALNYYLRAAWPHEAGDDPQSRFINERVHANIQKDGTYSVVPRMYGGVTTPAQLRRIAEVADRYRVPMVKVTGGQRIDLLGVEKADLPKVWADLDMPCGYAYGKALRTVKTCVGNSFCRFGTQDSTGLGVHLERAFDRLWAPAKVKMAVSGCPRNCAESTIKDVGIIGVESGWEIYIGGNGGIKAEVALFLVKLKSTTEVEEYVGAFLQLYREEARYQERSVHWVQRVGMNYVKARVVDDQENRKVLHQRLIMALQEEKDPWLERAREGVERHEFETLKVPQGTGTGTGTSGASPSASLPQ
jgi:nitrite reductase (NADH) large subunit